MHQSIRILVVFTTGPRRHKLLIFVVETTSYLLYIARQYAKHTQLRIHRLEGLWENFEIDALSEDYIYETFSSKMVLLFVLNNYAVLYHIATHA